MLEFKDKNIQFERPKSNIPNVPLEELSNLSNLDANGQIVGEHKVKNTFYIILSIIIAVVFAFLAIIYISYKSPSPPQVLESPPRENIADRLSKEERMELVKALEKSVAESEAITDKERNEVLKDLQSSISNANQ